jgi:hypothetical protein
VNYKRTPEKLAQETHESALNNLTIPLIENGFDGDKVHSNCVVPHLFFTTKKKKKKVARFSKRI